ncbi:hypothetical protein BegalDRAFT_1502 [Beggiatoa alba B18LD]|uniref:Uncharacterized protein n=1 Tax=Beggiatoa alba B18LD TaxID=395493 RepID=I3CFJ3_9GAMM|nr:hypothetical protein BegalDRAFT_1502 [Beggiatoa alba B18LD]
MTDIRWPGTDGWVKMSKTFDNGIEIHYTYNTNPYSKLCGMADDFKFKNK